MNFPQWWKFLIQSQHLPTDLWGLQRGMSGKPWPTSHFLKDCLLPTPSQGQIGLEGEGWIPLPGKMEAGVAEEGLGRSGRDSTAREETGISHACFKVHWEMKTAGFPEYAYSFNWKWGCFQCLRDLGTDFSSRVAFCTEPNVLVCLQLSIVSKSTSWPLYVIIRS